MYADPGRIVICSGFVHGLTLMGKVLRQRRVREAAVESYGLDIHRNLLAGTGLRTPCLPVDGLGAVTGELGGMRGVGAVLLTPRTSSRPVSPSTPGGGPR